MEKVKKMEIESSEDISFDNLYEAILQCFVIILSGYVAGRARLVTTTQACGIGSFVSKFCLPALLFQNMCKLDFSQVNWRFLLGIFISKATLFFLVGGVTLLVKRPVNLGYAGIFSIFCTQSNDFALGYPIVQALYGITKPEYLQYIYLVAPISLVMLNPLGFILMEIHRHRSVTRDETESYSPVVHVMKGVLCNPIVFMTAIGVAGNYVFSGTVPGVLDRILTIFSQAYNAAALFYLGLSMVGKIRSQLGLSLVIPILLITAKTLLLPLITWEVVGWLEPKTTNNSYSMYGFLYGTIPTAPSVFLFASDYGIGQDVIATGLVLGTFLSAPLMFVSAKMMTVLVVTGMDYADMLMQASFDVSIISLISCVWVTIVFVTSGKWKRIPHKFTLALLFSHSLACIGMVAFYAHGGQQMHGWQHFPIVILLLVGVLGARCWTAVIAVVMCLLQTRSLCYVLKMQFWFYFVGFGLPVLFTGAVFLVGSHDVEGEIDPSFHYGELQTAFSTGTLLVSLVATITSLVLWQRTERNHIPRTYESLPSEDTTERPITPVTDRDQGDEWSESQSLSFQEERQRDSSSNAQSPSNYRTLRDTAIPRARSIEDLIPSGNEHSTNYDALESVSERMCLLAKCSPEARHECRDRLQTYTVNSLMPDETPQEEMTHTLQDVTRAEYQTAHHLILLLLLLLSMFIGLFLCVWRLCYNKPSGIYVEIEFLDCVFNYGQGFLILIVFGFDTKLVFSPLIRRVRRLLFGAEVIRLPKLGELDRLTKQTCQQFTDYHKSNCSSEIVQDRRFRFRTFKGVFTGCSLCDWLLRVGLANDRDDAVAYGRRLLLGRVITHINSEQHFHDGPYYYKFLDTFEYMSC